MKALLIVLFISLASLCASLDKTIYCGEYIYNPTKEQCHNTPLKNTTYKCCYEFYKISSLTYPSCVPITQEEFKNFKDFFEKRKKMSSGNSDFSLDCSSEYITLSILSLILLLL